VKEDNGNDTPQPHKPFLVPMGSGLGAWAALGGRLPRSHSRQPTRNANGTGFGGAGFMISPETGADWGDSFSGGGLLGVDFRRIRYGVHRVSTYAGRADDRTSSGPIAGYGCYALIDQGNAELSPRADVPARRA
jgi:hypothetical protein